LPQLLLPRLMNRSMPPIRGSLAAIPTTISAYFRSANFGLAEKHFRRSVEQHPRDGESWVGLAATYDRLKRFDLADRAYRQASGILGETPELMNNKGFSYMLRGDYVRARRMLLAAQAKAPDNPYIRNNLRLLERAELRGKGIN
jgi:Flp pilus assembly protein TadD